MDITNEIGQDIAREHLTSYYISFLEDSESEVRTAAIRRLSDFGTILDSETLIKSVIPNLKKL